MNNIQVYACMHLYIYAANKRKRCKGINEWWLDRLYTWSMCLHSVRIHVYIQYIEYLYLSVMDDSYMLEHSVYLSYRVYDLQVSACFSVTGLLTRYDWSDSWFWALSVSHSTEAGTGCVQSVMGLQGELWRVWLHIHSLIPGVNKGLKHWEDCWSDDLWWYEEADLMWEESPQKRLFHCASCFFTPL